jgi:zeaxanthin glucosyltransferase
MAQIVVVAPPLAGHFNPLLALSHRLVAGGHCVTFVNQADAAALVARADVAFEAVGLDTHPVGSLAARTARMAKLSGPIGLRGTIRDVASLTDMLCRELPGTLRRLRADLIVADQMEAAGGLAAEHLGLPFVSVATALPINREPGVPPPYLGWRRDIGPRGIQRNLGGWRVTDWLMRPVGHVIERHARAFGLAPRRRAEECLSPGLQIAQAVATLDFPRAELPAHFHYLGPFRESGPAAFDLPEDGRPLAFCSLGTLQGRRRAIFRRVAAACEALGLRLVVAHGGGLSESDAGGLPGNPLVYDFVPQRAVLARCSVAISHCGFNTVLDAMSMGVPILALPLAFEQPATAARLAWAGAGRVLPAWAGEGRVRTALAELVENPDYARAAARMRADIEHAGGAREAARLIESMLGARGPIGPRAVATRAGSANGDARDDGRNENS